MTTKHPNSDHTKVLRIRINPGGRWYSLHPKDLDLEKYLNAHGGHATVKLAYLMSRNHTLSESSGRSYHKVVD